MVRNTLLVLTGLFLAAPVFADAVADCMSSCKGSEDGYTSCVASQCSTLYSQDAGIAGSATSVAPSASVIAPPDPSSVVQAVTQVTENADGTTTLTLSKDGGAAITAQINQARSDDAANVSQAQNAVAALNNAIAQDENLKSTAAASGTTTLFGTQYSAQNSSTNTGFQKEVADNEAGANAAIQKTNDYITNVSKTCNALNLLQNKAQTGCN